MIGRRVAGLAAIVSEMEPALIDELTDSGMPVVFYDVGTPRKNITNIRVDYRRGSRRSSIICITWATAVWALSAITRCWDRSTSA